jgi:protein SCO1/2
MNQNILKAGLLILLLAIPAFLFLFLRQFGENKFALPVMNPASADCSPNTAPDSVHRIPAFSFTDQDGNTLTQERLRGSVYVAEFFFTRCPDICLTMANELSRVQDAFRGNNQVKILSHSVDPEYDSVGILKEYAERYNADTQQWMFVTGDKAAIYQQARCGYFISAKEGTNENLDFIHSDKLVLVDMEGRIRGYYSGTKRTEVDRLITEIQVLLGEYK